MLQVEGNILTLKNNYLIKVVDYFYILKLLQRNNNITNNYSIIKNIKTKYFLFIGSEENEFLVALIELYNYYTVFK